MTLLRGIFIVALALALGRAYGAEAGLFVQGSELNLRRAPDAKAEVAGKVTIGTSCQKVAEADKGFVEVKCGELQGFTMGKLLGPDKPNLQKLVAQANDKSLSAQARLEAALRAAYLAPDNWDVLGLLKDAYYDAEFASFDEQPKGAKPIEEGGASCSTNQLWCIWGLFSDYDVLTVELRDGKYVAVLGIADTMHVFKGTFGAIVSSTIEPGRPIMPYTIITRGHYPLDPVLGKVLFVGAVVRDSNHGPMLAPVFLDPSAKKTLKSLPYKWTLLQGEPGSRFTHCEEKDIRWVEYTLGEVMLLVDEPVHERYSTRLITGVRKEGNVYHIAYFENPKTHQGPGEIVLEWPTQERNVALINGAPYGLNTKSIFKQPYCNNGR